jgi:hypothetical protein
MPVTALKLWHYPCILLLLFPCLLTSLSPKDTARVRAYLQRVYPNANVAARSDEAVVAQFESIFLFYNTSSAQLPAKLLHDLETPERYACRDKFSSELLVQREHDSRFPGLRRCASPPPLPYRPPSAHPQSTGPSSSASGATLSARSAQLTQLAGARGARLCPRDPSAYTPGWLLDSAPTAPVARAASASRAPTAISRASTAAAVHRTATTAVHRTRTWVEVTRIAFHGANLNKLQLPRRPIRPSDVLDISCSGWWYMATPGSGLFYDTGRGLFAPDKNRVMLELVSEAVERAEGAAREEWKAYLPSVEAFLRMSLAHFARALARLVGGGEAGGGGIAAGVRGGGPAGDAATAETAADAQYLASGLECTHGILSDHYDGLMVALARALGYDTLGMTATPLHRRGYFDKNAQELVDVRLPQRADGLFGWSVPGVQPLEALRHLETVVRWTSAQALAWFAEYAATRRLTLRDPFSKGDESRALVCAPETTVRLACRAHALSWEARAVYNWQQYCTARPGPPASASRTRLWAH